MIIKRTAEHHLQAWKKRPARKPLIIRGARQVGKTTLVTEFAKTYKNRILLNLEKASDALLFRKFREVKYLLESIFLSHNISISSAAETLLFIDEIQESPEAIQMLRYFYEEYPDLHVIAAGSLLEFTMRKVKSFPVGRVEYMYLHPLNFIEFLEASKHQAALEQLSKIPPEPHAHPVLLDLFHQYAIIGGMPEVVRTFLTKASLTELPGIYESIWATYKNDVEKYAVNDTERRVIKHVMSTAHLYVDQRIKFQNFGQSNYRSREVGEAIRNLNDARVIQLIYPTTDLEIPVKPDLRKSPRLQFLDTGLINHLLGIQPEMLGYEDLNQAYKGAIIPHLITQEIISLNTITERSPHFWIRDKKQSTAEVDLVMSYKNHIVPVEIKSGSEGTLKSLHQFIERSSHPFAVRMYAGEFRILKTKTPGGIPYYLMDLPYFSGTQLKEYLKYFLYHYSAIGTR